MLTSLALIFLVGLLFGKFFYWLKLPSLLGMMLAGTLLGPYGLGLLDDNLLLISADLRQLALVIILTRAGLALQVEDLKKVGRPAVLLCFLPAVCEMVGVVLLAPLLLEVSRLDVAIMGSVLAAVSPAVVVPRMLKLMEEGYIGGGMLPKLQNCIDAIEAGVSRVHILDGRIPHCLLLEIFTNKGIGTAILNDEESRYYNGEQ